MIIVKLMGGIGNQMFQYAAARRLAYVHGSPLKLDLSWFSDIVAVNTSRGYALDIFAIQEEFAAREEVEALTVRKQGFVECLIAKVIWRKPVAVPSYIREKQFHFDPAILNLSNNVYLDGYWQSEKYFAEIEDIIRKEFTVKTDQAGQNRKLAELIASSDSVSLHIRRGDYVSNPRTNKYHGICDMDYYSRCLEQLTETVKNPHFFIFSDERDWVSDNLKLPCPTTLVDHNGANKGYEDLRLISQCKHHIIANSSFSWWGAWLSDNSGKIVVAPKKWFADEKRNNQTYDLIPEGWTRI